MNRETRVERAQSQERQGGRDGLLQVAVDLFARRGFAGTSIRDIAGAAGCSVANVYHHFENKEALWLAILERSVGDMPARLREALAGLDEPRARFERLVRTHLAISEDFLLESQIFFIGEDRLSPAGNDRNRRLQREVLGIYIAELERLAAAGLVETTALKVMALNALGVINWQLRWTVPDATAAVRAAQVDAIVGFVLRGVADAGVAMGRPREMAH